MKFDTKLILAVVGGLVLAFLLSPGATRRERAASFVAGVFCAMLLTEPLIHLANVDFTTWQYAIAGILALSGDRLARRLLTLIDTAQIPWWSGKP